MVGPIYFSTLSALVLFPVVEDIVEVLADRDGAFSSACSSRERISLKAAAINPRYPDLALAASLRSSCISGTSLQSICAPRISSLNCLARATDSLRSSRGKSSGLKLVNSSCQVDTARLRVFLP